MNHTRNLEGNMKKQFIELNKKYVYLKHVDRILAGTIKEIMEMQENVEKWKLAQTNPEAEHGLPDYIINDPNYAENVENFGIKETTQLIESIKNEKEDLEKEAHEGLENLINVVKGIDERGGVQKFNLSDDEIHAKAAKMLDGVHKTKEFEDVIKENLKSENVLTEAIYNKVKVLEREFTEKGEVKVDLNLFGSHSAHINKHINESEKTDKHIDRHVSILKGAEKAKSKSVFAKIFPKTYEKRQNELLARRNEEAHAKISESVDKKAAHIEDLQNDTSCFNDLVPEYHVMHGEEEIEFHGESNELQEEYEATVPFDEDKTVPYDYDN